MSFKAAAAAPVLALGPVFATTPGAQSPVNPQPATPVLRGADLVLKTGKIITVDRAFTLAEAIAVAGERILAVGPDQEIAAHIAPWTHVVAVMTMVGGRVVHQSADWPG
jgi:hypothetical protein